MDQTAIKEINNQATAKALNEHIASRGGVVVVPKDHDIHDLLKMDGERRYFRGVFNTKSLKSFIEYVNDQSQSTESAELFLDKERMEAVAIFDLKDNDGTPRTAEHRAKFEAQHTPEYRAINALLGARQLDQRDLVDFAEEWGDVFNFFDTHGNPVGLKTAINSMRNMKVNASSSSESSVSDMAQSKSRTANIEAKGKDVTIGGFTAEIRLYEELAVEVVKVKFRLHAAGDDITVTARLMNQDRMIEAIATDLAARIAADATLKTYIGTFKA